MKTHFNTLLISVAVVTAAYLLGNSFQNRNNTQHSIRVTGLGEKSFTSDLIVWEGNFSRKSMLLKDAYAELDSDRESIRQYMVSKGIRESEIIFSSVSIDRQYSNRYDDRGNRISSEFAGYNLTQRVSIESKDVDKVENLSREVSQLIQSGVELYSENPQYYYTKLAELKLEMIERATKDARSRAEKIAGNAGGQLGSLKKADMGVFQIVAENSADEYSWGGSFNTYAKRKTATITVRLEYESK